MKKSIVRINRKISVPQSDITKLESDSNYTIVHFADRSKEVVAASLYKVHQRLNPEIFVRVNRSTVINLHLLEQLPNDSNLKIDYVNAQSLRVSRRREKELRSAFMSLRKAQSTL